MQMLEILVPNEGRKLKNLITALLKKGVITEAIVLNYAKSYILVDNKLQKTEMKLMKLFLTVEKTQLLSLISQIAGWNEESETLRILSEC